MSWLRSGTPGCPGFLDGGLRKAGQDLAGPPGFWSAALECSWRVLWCIQFGSLVPQNRLTWVPAAAGASEQSLLRASPEPRVCWLEALGASPSWPVCHLCPVGPAEPGVFPGASPDRGRCGLLLCPVAGGALAFVSPSLAVHKTSSAVDRQREYLLDMIPPRSIPQSATWK